MLDRNALSALIPQTGAMCLVDDVESFDASSIVCVSLQHLSPHNPLRRSGHLSSVHAIEFAAQAVALHGALNVPTRSPARGLLVSVRGCKLHAPALDGMPGPLRIEARRVAVAESLSGYEFVVSSTNGPVAEGRLGVFTERT